MLNVRKIKAFTLIELLVVISIIALLIGILLPALGAARTTARQMKSSTQVRGIHQGMAIYGETNDGWYPGLDSRGEPWGAMDGPAWDPSSPGDWWLNNTGINPSRRWAILMNEGFFPLEYLASPQDPEKVGFFAGPGKVDIRGISFALPQLLNNTGTGPRATKVDWASTTNSGAVVLSDRNAVPSLGFGGDSPANPPLPPESVWTDEGSEEWHGSIVKNDNSTTFVTEPVARTQYGSAAEVPEDRLFGNDNDSSGVSGDDTRMTYKTVNDISGHWRIFP